MKKYRSTYYFLIFSITFLLLTIIQVVPSRPMLLAERFIPGSGWIEVVLFSFFAIWMAEKLNTTSDYSKWRKRIWVSFSIFFFLQLLLGLLGVEECLMTGKLHFPIPAMILGGPIYRGELTFMVFLFVGTVILSGPAWCSQLCYLGSLDLLLSGIKNKRFDAKNMLKIKYSILILFISFVLILRMIHVSHLYAITFASLFGLSGIAIMLIYSLKTKRMIHCTYFCPIGSVVSLTKWINPFRVKITPTCDQCMKCTVTCKYNALQIQNIKDLKPGITCTNCGDCLSVCHVNALQYQFFKCSPERSRRIYIGLVVVIFSVFFAVART